MSGLPLPPGPRGHPLLGSALGFRRDPLQTFFDAWRTHGDLVRFRGPVEVFLVTHPDHLRHILVDRFDNYPHPEDFDRKVAVSVGRGLVTTEGEVWRRQRRMIEPTFRKEPMRAYTGVITGCATRMLDRWDLLAGSGRAVDVRTEMQSLTMEILARCLFGADWSRGTEGLGEAVQAQLEHINRKLIAVVDLPEKVPTRANRRFVEARRRLDDVVYRLIAERRRSPAPAEGTEPAVPAEGTDLLTVLMHTPDPQTGLLMTDEQLRDQVMTLFIAGHETAAATLSWICYLMSKHPAETERARREVVALLGDRPPAAGDLPQLRYLKMFVSEALRLYPPLWQVARMPLQDDAIGGYRIPAGSFMLLSTYITHRNPAFWENPEGFDPERFTRERSANRPRHAYLPYVVGPRNCVGMAFATMELHFVAAAILQRYRLDLVPGHPVVVQPDISLRAKHGIRVTVEHVTAPAARTRPTPGASTPTTTTEETHNAAACPR